MSLGFGSREATSPSHIAGATVGKMFLGGFDGFVPGERFPLLLDCLHRPVMIIYSSVFELELDWHTSKSSTHGVSPSDSVCFPLSFLRLFLRLRTSSSSYENYTNSQENSDCSKDSFCASLLLRLFPVSSLPFCDEEPCDVFQRGQKTLPRACFRAVKLTRACGLAYAHQSFVV